MRKEKFKTGFRIVIGLVFLGVGIKWCTGGEYLSGGIFLVAGVAFIPSLIIKKGGEK